MVSTYFIDSMSFIRNQQSTMSHSAGAGGSTVTPEQLKFAAAALSTGLGGAGAFVIGAVAPIPATIAIAGVGGCLYAAYRLENDLPIIPGRGDDNTPASNVVDVTPASA